MANLKDLQEMAKNGEISKKLLEDEEFKSELKKILEEKCQTEITNNDINEIIKEFETSLTPDHPLKEAELENVSGGVASKKRMAVAIGSQLIGAALGAVRSKATIPGGWTGSDEDYGRAIIGAGVGATGGKIVGALACKILGIN